MFERRSLIFHIVCLLLVSTPVAWGGDPNNGAKIYLKHCLSCHGSTGRSMTPGTPDFSMGQSLQNPDPVLAATIKSGKKLMPAYLGILKEEEIADVIGYIRTLF